MKALILNSGVGKRMGDITRNHPKCMTEISNSETIISRQLKQISRCQIEEVVITTGHFEKELIDYVEFLDLPLRYLFVNNPVYNQTNYIYSIYLSREYLDDDILLMHGDLVFETEILEEILSLPESSMTVSSSIPLPEKDFKAVIENSLIKKVGVEFFDNALAAQPLYKLNKSDWQIWLDEIIEFCENDRVTCYAENALNQVSDSCLIYPYDVGDRLCTEIDNPEDLERVRLCLQEKQCI